MLFKCTPEVALKLRARRVFAVMTSARELEERRRCLMYSELCSVAQCAGASGKFVDDMTKHYFDRAFPDRDKWTDKPAAAIETKVEKKPMSNEEAWPQLTQLLGQQ